MSSTYAVEWERRPPHITLGAAGEERAERLHRDSLVMLCHDHTLFPDDLDAMRRGGVTAKQVHICLDGLIYSDPDRFRASATMQDGYLKRGLVAMDYLYWQVEHSGGALVLALEPEDIRRAKEHGACALLLGAEGPRLIEGRLETLRMLHRLGLRHLQLSWAWQTTVGAPQSDKSGRGLTPFGRELIREMNRLGIIVDVAHLATRSILDAVETSSVPVLASHTGAAALNAEQDALLPDHAIQAIAARGGVVAIHFMSQLVKPGRHKATFAELMAQVEYVVRLVGPDSVALGPDYLYWDPRTWESQGITVPFSFADGVEDVSQVRNVTRGLVALGFDDADIRKLLGENLMRLFTMVRGAADRGPWQYTPYAPGVGACTDGATPL